MKRQTSASQPLVQTSHVLVVGAGAFGGWSALSSLRRGVQVSLVDAWGAGNSRASSGGESRIIRAIYGPGRIYTEMMARALELWRDNETRWQHKLFHQTSVLWMVSREDNFVRASFPFLEACGLPYQQLSTTEAQVRYPQINFEGVTSVVVEEEAGYLMARRACQQVLERFLLEGGDYRQCQAKPGLIRAGELREVILSDGSTVSADQYIFSCGPWLGQLFPSVLGDRIRSTRQEVFFFGTEAGDHRFVQGEFPAWIDYGQHRMYGIPGDGRRGFKIADDTRGPVFEPTTGERSISADQLKAARGFLEFRFPALKGAPLIETRVCQYANTPDHDFIIDRHPEAQNVWLVGGGSGHGFKHGPALGEYVADLVMSQRSPHPLFTLSRFSESFS